MESPRWKICGSRPGREPFSRAKASQPSGCRTMMDRRNADGRLPAVVARRRAGATCFVVNRGCDVSRDPWRNKRRAPGYRSFVRISDSGRDVCCWTWPQSVTRRPASGVRRGSATRMRGEAVAALDGVGRVVTWIKRVRGSVGNREDSHGGNWPDRVFSAMYVPSHRRQSGGLFSNRLGNHQPPGATSVGLRTTSRHSEISGERPHTAVSDVCGPDRAPRFSTALRLRGKIDVVRALRMDG